MSFLNGLSALGAGVAEYAGKAGLEEQRASLARDNMTLADQLATVRETAGRAQEGDIRAAAAEKEHTFLSGEGVLNRATQEKTATIGAGATLGAAKMHVDAVYAQIAAGAPGREQDILASRAKVALENVQTDAAKQLQAAHTELQTVESDPNPDPAKIQAARSKVSALDYSSSTEAASRTAAVNLYRVDQQAVEQLNTRLQLATQNYNLPEMSDANRSAAKAEMDSLTIQLRGAQRAMQDSGNRARSSVNPSGTSAPSASGGDRPPLASFGGNAAPVNPNAGPRKPKASGIINYLDAP